MIKKENFFVLFFTRWLKNLRKFFRLQISHIKNFFFLFISPKEIFFVLIFHFYRDAVSFHFLSNSLGNSLKSTFLISIYERESLFEFIPQYISYLKKKWSIINPVYHGWNIYRDIYPKGNRDIRYIREMLLYIRWVTPAASIYRRENVIDLWI
jgi:hypothetical protein